MTAALAVRDLQVQVDGRTLLDGIDFDVAPGEWVAIIGPNGAGKSTLLRALVGAVRAEGSIELDGVSAGELKQRVRARKVAWVPQTPTIPSGMRVGDYVLLGRTPHLHPLATEGPADIDAVRRVLDELDMTDLAERTVMTLSGGERQRAIIARALVQESPLLLLDEPTTALDLGHQQEVLDLLDDLRSTGERALVTTMHDLNMAGQYPDRLILLADGRIAAEGRAREVITVNRVRDHYDAAVHVHITPAGSVVVLPDRRRPDSESNQNGDTHAD